MNNDKHQALDTFNKSNKRYLFFLYTLTILMVILVFVTLIRTIQIGEQVKVSIKTTQEERNSNAKKLAQQNEVILQYLKCIALIKPQDRTAENVQACVDQAKLPTTNELSTVGPPTSSTARTIQPATSSSPSTSPQSTPNTSPPTSSPSADTPPTSCTVNLLGVHLLC